MASRRVQLPEVGTVVLTKRQSSRSIKISIGHDGEVKVSLPNWIPFQAGLKFVADKKSWIINQKQDLLKVLIDGQAIGKAHHLRFLADETAQRVTTKKRTSEIVVRYPAGLNTATEALQRVARTTAIKALREEAESLLPKRLDQLAGKYGFEYGSVVVRNLKSRWGSCNARGDITLNLFLMQLPWPLIDYVLLHELVHTKVLRHGPPFWEELSRHLPAAKELRRQILVHRPAF